MTLGLGQALAALEAQAKEVGAKAYRDHVVGWLWKDCHQSPYRTVDVEPAMAELLKAIMEKGQSDYGRGLAETIAFAGWLKKLAQAWLEEADEEQNDD